MRITYQRMFTNDANDNVDKFTMIYHPQTQEDRDFLIARKAVFDDLHNTGHGEPVISFIDNNNFKITNITRNNFNTITGFYRLTDGSPSNYNNLVTKVEQAELQAIANPHQPADAMGDEEPQPPAP